MSKRKKNKPRKKEHALFGVSHTQKQSYVNTLKESGLILLAAIAAGGVGAALGKHSLLAGIPVTLLGIHKKNHYLTAAGLGLTLSNGFQKPGQTASSTAGVDGLDMKQITEGAKERISTFFQNFTDKLYLPKTSVTAVDKGDKGTSGLGEAGKEPVSYFINPYGDSGTGALDMSELDKVQEQIASMNASKTSVSKPAMSGTDTAELNALFDDLNYPDREF